MLLLKITYKEKHCRVTQFDLITLAAREQKPKMQQTKFLGRDNKSIFLNISMLRGLLKYPSTYVKMWSQCHKFRMWEVLVLITGIEP